MNHMQSLKFESKLYASIKEKMEEMQQHNMSWIEVFFQIPTFPLLFRKIDQFLSQKPKLGTKVKKKSLFPSTYKCKFIFCNN